MDITELMITELFSDIQRDVFATYRTVSIVLAICSTVKNGRDVVSCEDVVVSYLTTFKLMFNVC
ncbi:hypothetical protein ALNOE001_18540 [Candidatus Methanobinarius endosymbioticus]|uniref:Uncharacterized protein n=1 Tax=Candidatus Methanobinarius endosymbioticus TaxID=2006182 RepID=A0A366M9U7_9EURY|nr:hypothetical protein ALNOE001_18540 [Candidatus Methanobinarius endosymbioticus]